MNVVCIPYDAPIQSHKARCHRCGEITWGILLKYGTSAPCWYVAEQVELGFQIHNCRNAPVYEKQVHGVGT